MTTPIADLILQLMQQGGRRGLPMEASPELAQYLRQAGSAPSGPSDMTNVADLTGQLPDNLQYDREGWPVGTESWRAPHQGPAGGNVTPFPEQPPPISRDPWFDDALAQTPDTPREPTFGGDEWANQRYTLVGDVMQALGIEPRGSFDRYYSQLLEVDDAFITRMAQTLGITTDQPPNIIRHLLAAEFETFGSR